MRAESERRLHAERQLREEEIGAASSELSRLLNLILPSASRPPGSHRRRPVGDPQVPLKRVDPCGSPRKPRARGHRRQSIRVCQERTRPLFPTLPAGYSRHLRRPDQSNRPVPGAGFGREPTRRDCLLTLQNAGGAMWVL